ncbi:MAG: M14 family zinc carboxypeptidase [Myxococcota bacterium]|nr:M14 family zinc carboxypeptidase [Myxococcota bacterium]
MVLLALIPLLPTAQAAVAPVQQAWIRLPDEDTRAQAESMGANFAEGVDGPWVLMDARADDWPALQARFETRAAPATIAPPSPEGYRSAEEINAALRTMAEDPAATLLDLGESGEGRPILGLSIGPQDAPAFRILGAHHGDEAPSAELALAVAEAVLGGEGAWAGLSESLHLVVVPVVNPDGLEAGSRYNASGVDLNRNYDYEWGEGAFRGPAPFSEPETRAVRTLSLYHPFHAGLSLHTGALNLGWPWNHTTELSPDEDRMAALGEAYARYCTHPDFYTTNGAAWYTTTGDTNDWSLGRQGTLDLTLEAWEDKQPAASQLDTVLNTHLRAIAELLSTPVPLRVQVVDAQTGQPLQAELSVGERASPFWTGPDGDGSHILEVGIYTLETRAPGYTTDTRELRLPAEEIVSLEVALEPADLLEQRLEPTLLPCCEPTELQILDASGAPIDSPPALLTLSRPGFESKRLALRGDSYPIDPSYYAPGPWTVESEQGVLPNALLVASQGGLIRLEELQVDAQTVDLTASGLGPSPSLFLLSGPTRGLTRLELQEHSDTHLRAALPEGLSGTVDLLIVSRGEQLVIADLLGEPELDPGTPAEPLDTAPPWQGQQLVGYGGCSSAPRPVPGSLWLLLATPLLLWRARRCA